MYDALAFDAALVAGARGIVLAGAGWCLAVLVAAAVESGTRGRVRALSGVGCPVAWRPVLLLVVGSALALGAATPASARSQPPLPGPVTPQTLLPVPDRSFDTDAEATGAPRGERVEVRPGDSLWSLARAALPARANDAAVAALVHAVHTANRDVVGDDPDLIRPGQRLWVPTPEEHRP